MRPLSTTKLISPQKEVRIDLPKILVALAQYS